MTQKKKGNIWIDLRELYTQAINIRHSLDENTIYIYIYIYTWRKEKGKFVETTDNNLNTKKFKEKFYCLI